MVRDGVSLGYQRCSKFVSVFQSEKKIYNRKKSHVVPRIESMVIWETIDASFQLDDNALMSMLNWDKFVQVEVNYHKVRDGHKVPFYDTKVWHLTAKWTLMSSYMLVSCGSIEKQ